MFSSHRSRRLAARCNRSRGAGVHGHAGRTHTSLLSNNRYRRRAAATHFNADRICAISGRRGAMVPLPAGTGRGRMFRRMGPDVDGRSARQSNRGFRSRSSRRCWRRRRRKERTQPQVLRGRRVTTGCPSLGICSRGRRPDRRRLRSRAPTSTTVDTTRGRSPALLSAASGSARPGVATPTAAETSTADVCPPRPCLPAGATRWCSSCRNGSAWGDRVHR